MPDSAHCGSVEHAARALYEARCAETVWSSQPWELCDENHRELFRDYVRVVSDALDQERKR